MAIEDQIEKENALREKYLLQEKLTEVTIAQINAQLKVFQTAMR